MATNKNQNDFLIHNLFNLFKVYCYFTFLFLVFRVFFTYYFGELSLLTDYKTDLLQAFYTGWKYDNLAISYFLTPVFLISIFTSLLKNQKFNNFMTFISRFYLVIISLFIIFILSSDMAFFNYFQDHINILFYGIIEDDTTALIETLRKNYPVEIVLIFLLLFVIFSFWFMTKIVKGIKSVGSFVSPGIGKFTLMTILSLVILIGGLRGGYSVLVISPKYTDFSENEFINQVALNGLVALEKTIKLRQSASSAQFNLAKNLGYGSNIKQAFSDYLGINVKDSSEEELIKLIYKKTDFKNELKHKKWNVIVLVMESFGSHWLQFEQENFSFYGDLKTHFDQDIYFPNFISADNGTIGSLMTLTTNIPNRPGARFLSESRYMQMPIQSAAHLPFKANGHESSFYYGGKLGWRDIGKFYKYQGFDNIRGENFLKKELKLEGKVGTEWGLFDEHLLDGILKQIKTATKSQFIMALSTTNHPPFEIPNNYQKKEIKIPSSLNEKISRERDVFIKRFECFQYANAMLAKFLKQIKNSDLAHNTIVAITGDHNFWGFMNYDKSEAYSKHTVPMYFYLPQALRADGVNLNKVGSHKDIMPTLYNLILSDTEYLAFGVDLFSQQPGIAFNTNIYADQTSVHYKNRYYSWQKQMPLLDIDEHFKKSNDLDKKYKSTLSIADFFLRYSYKKHKKLSH